MSTEPLKPPLFAVTVAPVGDETTEVHLTDDEAEAKRLAQRLAQRLVGRLPSREYVVSVCPVRLTKPWPWPTSRDDAETAQSGR